MKKIFISACLIAIFSAISAQVVWLDADTGNEMDDLYAIARLVREPGIKIAGISSAHFNNPDLLVFEKWNAYETRGLNSVAESQRLNEEILTTLGRTDIPHPVGADRQVGRAWGGKDPRDSPAARAIISAVKSLPEGQKLDIITIETRIMWDLALVEAFLHPDKASLREVLTPPENTQRIIKVYTKIDTESLSKDFWETVKQ